MMANQLRPRYFDNARLAVDLALALGAKGTDAGTMSNFSSVPTDWVCPGCARSKREIARLDKNSNLYCAIHSHHDHLHEGIAETVGFSLLAIDQDLGAIMESMVRFSNSWVCMDCNMADGLAKRMICAPKYFSFSPAEIRKFIDVKHCASHKVIKDIAERTLLEIIDSYEDILEYCEGILYAKCPTSLENALGATISHNLN